MITNLQAATLKQNGMGKDNLGFARRMAAKRFDRVYLQGKHSEFWAKLTGRAHALPIIPRKPETTHRTTRTTVVPLSKIIGTEGRNKDFDAAFRPLNLHNRERWINIASAVQTGVVLPAVELLQAGEKYYIRDGHHRVSVAKMMGQLEIDARVVN